MKKENKTIFGIIALVVIIFLIFSNVDLFAVVSEYRDTLIQCNDAKDAREDENFVCTTCTQISDGRYKTSCDCASGYTYTTGQCISTTTVPPTTEYPSEICYESDGGDPTVKGTTTQGSFSATDKCMSTYVLREYWCHYGEPDYEDLDCRTELDDPNYFCSDGACVEAVSGCEDSDGWLTNTFFTKGTATSAIESYTDTCISSTILREYTCSGSDVDYISYTCKGGCSSSKCDYWGKIQGKVTDCESGLAIRDIVVTYQGFESRPDMTDSSGNYEIIIDSPGYGYLQFRPFGTSEYSEDRTDSMIKNSAKDQTITVNMCLSKTGGVLECVDTDGGKDEFDKGFISINGRTVTEDYCLSTTSVREYFCDSGDVDGYSNTAISCPSGYSCKYKGKCEKITTPTEPETPSICEAKFILGTEYCKNGNVYATYTYTDCTSEDALKAVCSTGYTCEDGICKGVTSDGTTNGDTSEGTLAACNPGDKKCIDDFTYAYCDDLGQWATEEQCPGFDPLCHNGECISEEEAENLLTGELSNVNKDRPTSSLFSNPDWVPDSLTKSVAIGSKSISYFWLLMGGMVLIISYLLFTRKPIKRRRR